MFRLRNSIVFVALFPLLVSCGGKIRDAADSPDGSAVLDGSVHPPGTDGGAPFTGTIETRVEAHRRSNQLVSLADVVALNLNRADWSAGTSSPLLSLRAPQESSPRRIRIPQLFYYSATAHSDAYFSLDLVVQLAPEAVRPSLPQSLVDVLAARSISVENLEIATVMSQIPTVYRLSDFTFYYPRNEEFSLFPHLWSHDVVTPATSIAYSIACGLFDARGIVKSASDEVGIDELKTHSASVHPGGGGDIAYSGRSFLFSVDPSVDSADFWALCVDEDPASPHNGSAILLYQILIAKELDRSSGSFTTAIRQAVQGKSEGDAIGWTAQTIVDRFGTSEINATERLRILNRLQSLFRTLP